MQVYSVHCYGHFSSPNVTNNPIQYTPAFTQTTLVPQLDPHPLPYQSIPSVYTIQNMFLDQLGRLRPRSKLLGKIILKSRLFQIRLNQSTSPQKNYLDTLNSRRNFNVFQNIPFFKFMLTRSTLEELAKSLLRRGHWFRHGNFVGCRQKEYRDIRLRICCSTSSSGFGRMDSFADNSSSRRFLSSSASRQLF
jgi:hypothetical protein